MALYNLSDFIMTIKEDIGIKDIPLPVTEEQLVDRFYRSALTDFSVLYPRIHRVLLNDNERIDEAALSVGRCTRYRIPAFEYAGTEVLSVTRFEIAKPTGYSDFFVPTAQWASPDAIISAVSDMRTAASLASVLTKAPTHIFAAPDIIEVYNGWAGGNYEAEILLMHDKSLSTIPPGAFMDLRELAALDMSAYLYNQLKRKDQIDAGVGTIQLKIDDWASAWADYKALLKQWRADGVNLDFDHIRYF